MTAPGTTPGPWSFHAYGNPTVRECPTLGADYRYADYCIGSGNMMIADVRLAFGGGEGGFPTVGDEAEFTANAHLIAAAPDLFEALRHGLHWLEGSARAGALAALAKAQGEAK